MDSKLCTLYKNSIDTIGKEKHVMEVLDDIGSGKWMFKIEELRALKTKDEKDTFKRKYLPAATFSALLSLRRQDPENVIEYTQLLVLDLDKYPPKNHKKIKELLMDDLHIVAVFDSPSGRLKALIAIDSQVEHHRDTAFGQVEDYMLETYNIVIDRSGKDFTRLCYVSYDPNLYFTNEYEPFHVDTTKSNFVSVAGYDEDFEASTSLQHVFDTVDKWTKEGPTGTYGKGNRNSYIFALACKLNRAGVELESAINVTYKRYNGLKFKEVAAAIRSAYKNNPHDFGAYEVRAVKTNQTKLFRK